MSSVISGKTLEDVDYLIIRGDSVLVENGDFADTITIEENQYDYVKLNTWKWPQLI